MCDQFYGIGENPGGGLFVLERLWPESAAPRPARRRGGHRPAGCRADCAADQDSPPRFNFDGNVHGADFEGGSFLSPALYLRRPADRLRLRRSRGVAITTKTRPAHAIGTKRCYHLFKVDGGRHGLEQLTDGTWNDFDPCWLPNGRLAFICERRGGYLRCGRVARLHPVRHGPRRQRHPA